jgi:hypothetical protein
LRDGDSGREEGWQRAKGTAVRGDERRKERREEENQSSNQERKKGKRKRTPPVPIPQIRRLFLPSALSQALARVQQALSIVEEAVVGHEEAVRIGGDDDVDGFAEGRGAGVDSGL